MRYIAHMGLHFGVCQQQRSRPALLLDFWKVQYMVSKLATSEIPIFQLVSVVEETGWSLALSKKKTQLL